MPRRKPNPDPSPLNPGERQSCRFPDWWDEANQRDLEAAHRRARQLVAQGHGAITWADVWGQR